MGAERTAYAIKLLHSLETGVCYIPDDHAAEPGQYCIVNTPFGRDLGKIVGFVQNHNDRDEMPEWSYSRPAEEGDLQQWRDNRGREKEAMQICRRLIERHKLSMKLVAAHFVLLDPRLLFFFTADSRVDFRGLISDLIPHFKTRIELRQVGVRDESRMVGGLGVCGRAFCCNSVSDRLKPVSIKMAKTQNIPVSSSKISGACGRLLCCLNFEYEAYSDERKNMPNPGAKIEHDGERCTVCDINVLANRVTIIGPEGGRRTIPGCALSFDESARRWTVKECSCAERNVESAIPDLT